MQSNPNFHFQSTESTHFSVDQVPIPRLLQLTMFPFQPIEQWTICNSKHIFDLQLKTLVSCTNRSNPLNNSFLGCLNSNRSWFNTIIIPFLNQKNKNPSTNPVVLSCPIWLIPSQFFRGKTLPCFAQKTLFGMVKFRWRFNVCIKSSLVNQPLINIEKAIENGHRNSWFTHNKHGDIP